MNIGGMFGVAALCAATLVSCGASQHRAGQAAHVLSAAEGVRTIPGRPSLAVVERYGDPMGALAFAASTEGLAPERGPVAAVALSALLESRTRGADSPVTITSSWEGFRGYTLVRSKEEGARLLKQTSDAWLAPVSAAEVESVQRRVAALTHRPLVDPSMADVARCRGDVFAVGTQVHVPVQAEIEGWRRAVATQARVAFAFVGPNAWIDVAHDQLRAGPAWPEGARPLAVPFSTGGKTFTQARPSDPVSIHLFAVTSSAGAAVAAAAHMGAPRSALTSRIEGIDVTVRDVTATARAGGGCVVVQLETTGSLAHASHALGVGRAELEFALRAAARDPLSGARVARQAPDAREAAQRAAWWALSRHGDAENTLGFVASTPPQVDGAKALAAFESSWSRAPNMTPVVEGRVRVESGQGQLWALVGSPCAGSGESEHDAGLTATLATAAATRSEGEPWIAGDGIGVLAHDGLRAGESEADLAERIGTAAARAFAAERLSPVEISHGRAALRARAAEEGRGFDLLAKVLSPGRIGVVAPHGTADSLVLSADETWWMRAKVVRTGPLRAAVLTPFDEQHGQLTVAAADRWVLRSSAPRACPPSSPPIAAEPGTYFVDRVPGAPAQAWLALPLTDAASETYGDWLASALGSGLLSAAVSGLALSARAAAVGVRGRKAVVVRLSTTPTALEPAVQQVRALFDRLRQGAITDDLFEEADRARKTERHIRLLDPRARLVALWRNEGEPAPITADGARAFAKASLRDDALVIVATRSK